jgi:hypothetical protein
MIIGRIFCDKCGKDCTDLYGFALMTRGSVRNKNQQNELMETKKKYGKDEFCWCWGCTAEAFGVKPLPVKEPETITKDSAQTVVIESCNKEKKK